MILHRQERNDHAVPRHVAIWVADLDSARDFYSHWFDGHANGLYENPRTGLRTHILHFAETPAGERGPAWRS